MKSKKAKSAGIIAATVLTGVLAVAGINRLCTRHATTNPSLETRIVMIEESPNKKVSVEISPMMLLDEKPEGILIQYLDSEQKNPVITYAKRFDGSKEIQNHYTLWALEKSGKPVKISTFPERGEGNPQIDSSHQAVIFNNQRYDFFRCRLPQEQEPSFVIHRTDVPKAMKNAKKPGKSEFVYRGKAGDTAMNLYGVNKENQIVLGNFNPLSDAGEVLLLDLTGKRFPIKYDDAQKIKFEDVWANIQNYIPSQETKRQNMIKQANEILKLNKDGKVTYGGIKDITPDGKYGTYMERQDYKGEKSKIQVYRVNLSNLELGVENEK